MNTEPKWYEARNEIAEFALPLIKKLRTRGHGYPAIFLDLHNGKVNDAYHHWQSILSDIQFALQAIVDDELDQLPERKYDDVRRGCELFGKWFLDLWD